ncbi:hypothetical protein AB3U99_05485 [Niallia sp. JL1B1071]|uniref:hypothetical protein n=1 Tax=Niallia tiangongensis TaxID=3237105 RepID=UPI0037DDB8C5
MILVDSKYWVVLIKDFWVVFLFGFSFAFMNAAFFWHFQVLGFHSVDERHFHTALSGFWFLSA